MHLHMNISAYMFLRGVADAAVHVWQVPTRARAADDAVSRARHGGVRPTAQGSPPPSCALARAALRHASSSSNRSSNSNCSNCTATATATALAPAKVWLSGGAIRTLWQSSTAQQQQQQRQQNRAEQNRAGPALSALLQAEDGWRRPSRKSTHPCAGRSKRSGTCSSFWRHHDASAGPHALLAREAEAGERSDRVGLLESAQRKRAPAAVQALPAAQLDLARLACMT
mmetsp:Transcript_2338/g.7157  ORF Transcript_2338/g.7157 Transcript_2338/m.7157 type:complete len:227 (+) Transcript_2338:121-801(+)